MVRNSGMSPPPNAKVSRLACRATSSRHSTNLATRVLRGLCTTT